jgi:lactate dehydrogenase-like 2-hydroxyacid dehydrogenase
VGEARELTSFCRYGHIGAETARMAHAFGSTIVALTRSGVRKNIGGYHVPHTGDLTGALPVAYYSSTDPASVASFLGRCDVVVNTLPSEQGTKDFIGRVELTAMKGDAVLVNIGRGDTVDTDALVEALGGKAVEGEASDAVGTLRIGGVSLE